MKIWVAYRFTGADQSKLKTTLLEIRQALESAGHVVSTMAEDITRWNSLPMLEIEAIRRMRELSRGCDAMLSICNGVEPSEGRGYECGMFTERGQATVMAVQSNVMLSEYYEGLYLANPANEKLGVPAIIRFHDFAFIPQALASRDRIVVEPAVPVSVPLKDSGIDMDRRRPSYPFKTRGG